MLDLSDLERITTETSKQIEIRTDLEHSVYKLVHKLYEDLTILNWIHDDPIKGRGAKKKNRKLEKALEKYLKSKE
jgi:hypothetical protein